MITTPVRITCSAAHTRNGFPLNEISGCEQATVRTVKEMHTSLSADNFFIDSYFTFITDTKNRIIYK
jgi:hypothetical protein